MRRLEGIITRLILQDVFKKASCNYVLKTSSRHFEDVLEDRKVLRRRRLQDVSSTSSPRQMFAENYFHYYFLLTRLLAAGGVIN